MKSRLVVTPALAEAVRVAKDTQGHTWETLQAAGGPSAASMSGIVKGDGRPISDSNCKKLDKALGWAAGTARRLADPTVEVSDAPEQKPTITRVVDGLVVEVTDEPQWLDQLSRLRWWLDLGREILSDVGDTLPMARSANGGDRSDTHE